MILTRQYSHASLRIPRASRTIFRLLYLRFSLLYIVNNDNLRRQVKMPLSISREGQKHEQL